MSEKISDKGIFWISFDFNCCFRCISTVYRKSFGMEREKYVITCTAGQHYSFWFVRLQLRNEEFSNIFLMSSKGVRISLNKQRALHIESKLAFSTLKVLFYSLSLRRVSTKLWGVMNSILFDYQSQPTRPRKSENSLIEFYLLNWSIFDAPNRVNLERNRQKKKASITNPN